MSTVFVSTSNLRYSNDLFEILSVYQSMNLEAVELGSGHPPFPDMINKLKEIPFTYCVHNYFPLEDPTHLMNISSLEDENLAKTITIAKNAISICHLLGGKMYSIHAGFRSNVAASSLGKKLIPGDIVSYNEAFDKMIITTIELCDYAASMDIDILVENHVLTQFNLTGDSNSLLFLCAAEEIVRFANSIQRDNFGILLDVGHLNVSANTLDLDRFEFIESISPWIKLFHLSDNDGHVDQSLPFNEDAWFAPVVKAFHNIPCVIETKVNDLSLLTDQLNIVYKWKGIASIN